MIAVDVFHLPSLLLVIAAGALPIAGLLAMQWLQNRRNRFMLYWSFGFVAAGGGALLQAFRGTLPTLAIVGVSNALLSLAVGLIWAGFRAFDRRPAPVPLVVAG
ncbi:hypothetical protein J8J27_21115, partial [Mycobacterium tuberculosis]|nr:hypothetical protein [Mycobacterium tuberculosis]